MKISSLKSLKACGIFAVCLLLASCGISKSGNPTEEAPQEGNSADFVDIDENERLACNCSSLLPSSMRPAYPEIVGTNSGLRLRCKYSGNEESGESGTLEIEVSHNVEQSDYDAKLSELRTSFTDTTRRLDGTFQQDWTWQAIRGANELGPSRVSLLHSAGAKRTIVTLEQRQDSTSDGSADIYQETKPSFADHLVRSSEQFCSTREPEED